MKKEKEVYFFLCSALADVKPKLCGSPRACVAVLTRVCGEPAVSCALAGAVPGGCAGAGACAPFPREAVSVCRVRSCLFNI